MGKARPRAVVLDAGAIIAFDRGQPRMRALVREALESRASVVLVARRENAVVVTSDVDDLRRLDPGIALERI